MSEIANISLPVWFDGKKINEALFCTEFVRDYPMISVNDAFFTVNGRVRDENRIRKAIYNRIKPYITSGIAKQNESRYFIEYTNKVNIGGGKFVRGFVGIQPLQKPLL